MNVNINFDFYNTKEENEFNENYPELYQLAKPFAGHTVSIPLEDFKTYFLFRHQNNTLNNYQSFNDFYTKLAKNWGYYDDHFIHNSNNNSFSATHIPNDTVELAESIGVAGALAISSKLFLSITQADWRKIPILRTRDLDFEHLAADSNKYLVVESKGSIVNNNGIKTSAITNHKNSIKDKKADTAFKKKYNNQSDVCYGIITVADMNNTLQSWLVDPPAPLIDIEPEKYKLLSRLYYYNDYYRHISTRSYLSLLLPNRIKDIERSSDWISFNKKPIIDYNFDKIRISDSFINSRSSFTDNRKEYIGATYIISDYVYFTGLSIDLLEIIISQDFDRIISYRAKSYSLYSNVRARIGINHLNRNTLVNLGLITEKHFDNHFWARGNFEITIASSGLVYGRTSLENLSKN